MFIASASSQFFNKKEKNPTIFSSNKLHAFNKLQWQIELNLWEKNEEKKYIQDSVRKLNF